MIRKHKRVSIIAENVAIALSRCQCPSESKNRFNSSPKFKPRALHVKKRPEKWKRQENHSHRIDKLDVFNFAIGPFWVTFREIQPAF